MATRKTQEVSLESLIGAEIQKLLGEAIASAVAAAPAAPKKEQPKTEVGLTVKIHEGSDLKFGDVGVYKTYNGTPRMKLGLKKEQLSALIEALQEAASTLG